MFQESDFIDNSMQSTADESQIMQQQKPPKSAYDQVKEEIINFQKQISTQTVQLHYKSFQAITMYRTSQEQLLVEYLEGTVAFYSPQSLAQLNVQSYVNKDQYLMSALVLKDQKQLYLSFNMGEIALVEPYSQKKISSLKIKQGLNQMKQLKDNLVAGIDSDRRVYLIRDNRSIKEF